MYRLLAVDLDDTLLDKDLRISEDNRRALALARRAGVVVTLATGRMYRATLPFARELEIDAPLITYQGALVKHAVTREVVVHRPVPLACAMDIIARVQSRGYHINIYLDDHLYVERHTDESRLYQSISGVQARAVGPLVPFLKEARQDPTKVLVIAREEKLDELATELRPLYGDNLHITKSKPYFLEFSHPQATKGHALAAVAAAYGFKPGEVIAVGDSYNDLEMIEWAGLGVAVANARPQVKARADYVTASNEDGGVARVVEKFILGYA
ncbi:Cof subfamily protein (haloacid dehalogenase superfamily) [Desulfofundulus luciae]|uniref:Cof subfamily protein (Haloacid dehalogenase superfamily) n=1 Tax=Desulfofundulus luciae TaxID=74702 RepID=A0ABU0AXB6_9FIRM|nr:Cof-type HAD-IIB family hydrolase [Desulfofundulus luciae]MDQ0285133.1 Cof subfamily protein (haloacid dehalogenase superfamily) [Desulfofundulus luciae]